MIGTETVLLAESHVTLRRVNHPDLPFAKAYSYGKSTKNQRIEAWWNILTEGQTQEWKLYFGKLEAEGYFNGSETDKSCLQFLYMDMIRSHIHRFIEIHNSHPIRLQRNRQHYLPTGQPFLLYYYPENGKDYKEKVDEKVLADLENKVAEYDLDEYLPISTMELYSKFLQEAGYPQQFSYSDTRHREAYIYLRDKVSVYIAQGGEVQLTSRPSGAADWILANQTHEIEAHRGAIGGIVGDTMMQLIATDDEIDHEDEVYEKKQEQEQEQELELGELNDNSTNQIHDSDYFINRTPMPSSSINNNSFPFFLNSNRKSISNQVLFNTKYTNV